MRKNVKEGCCDFLLRDVVFAVVLSDVATGSYWTTLDHISSRPGMHQKVHVITERELITNIQLPLSMCHSNGNDPNRFAMHCDK
jgi:hypothetical protein